MCPDSHELFAEISFPLRVCVILENAHFIHISMYKWDAKYVIQLNWMIRYLQTSFFFKLDTQLSMSILLHGMSWIFVTVKLQFFFNGDYNIGTDHQNVNETLKM